MGYGIWKANSKVITKLIAKQAAQEEAAVEEGREGRISREKEQGEGVGRRNREKGEAARRRVAAQALAGVI